MASDIRKLEFKVRTMSTKSSMADGKNFHLYQDIFDADNVFLELNSVQFEATPQTVTVAIPREIWEKIRQHKFDTSKFIGD
jgi:hypothetical protein